MRFLWLNFASGCSSNIDYFDTRCADDWFGLDCAQECDCDVTGTALCSHIDGKCFCEGNYFGPRCQMHCPFGFDGQSGCLKKLTVNNSLYIGADK